MGGGLRGKTLVEGRQASLFVLMLTFRSTVCAVRTNALFPRFTHGNAWLINIAATLVYDILTLRTHYASILFTYTPTCFHR